eukprot:CAMPEP_0168540108 /NCGR_PEP_ID=MMETSP0413-20121227/97_1 /TAXON_ID=136452 /ORGANISM="Filamoeba nolandi, Strain NC-AS-23-1" /LENGTH=101 /DNA_ID=CAMNT_0008569813 /DNA_START=223 /DNA_END=528 /DNA_ORIENTATION=+
MEVGNDHPLNFYYKPTSEPVIYTEVIEDEIQELEKPDLKLFLEEGSLLLLTEDAFTNFAHGITSQESDTVTADLANIHLISAKVGETYPRKDRVSIVVWQE